MKCASFSLWRQAKKQDYYNSVRLLVKAGAEITDHLKRDAGRKDDELQSLLTELEESGPASSENVSAEKCDSDEKSDLSGEESDSLLEKKSESVEKNDSDEKRESDEKSEDSGENHDSDEKHESDEKSEDSGESHENSLEKIEKLNDSSEKCDSPPVSLNQSDDQEGMFLIMDVIPFSFSIF